MAGDWIKMRGNLWDDPRVARLVDMTDTSEAAIVGALYWLWATADQHTEDGIMPGLTTRAIDRKTGVKGFADALLTIGWLEDNEDGVRIVNFEEHNGASAKRRSLDGQRKANSRAMSASEADKPRTNNGQIAPTCGAREEKRREEKELIPSVAKATGDKSPLTPDEIIFGYGVPLLTNAGISDKQARSFLGGLRKSHGDDALVDALRECIRAKPLQPLEWMAKILPPIGAPPKRNKQEQLEDRNRAVVDRLLAKETMQ